MDFRMNTGVDQQQLMIQATLKQLTSLLTPMPQAQPQPDFSAQL
jgi:hypothetical protein